jgi:predicted HAD superfamily Cof-like phosphohydrolase
MVTVLRKHGLRFVIYTADHEPAHVHVYGDGEARIDILTLKVLTQGGLSDRDVRRAALIVEENRQLFMETWRKYHG